MVPRLRRTAVVAATAALLAALLGPAAVAQRATAYVSVDWGVLNVRSGPGTNHPIVTQHPHGTALTVVCQTGGEYISGRERATSTWNRLADGRYVTDAFVSWPEGSAVPWCGGGARVHTDGSVLNVRSNASTWNTPLGRLANGTALDPQCQISGERFAGTVRTTSAWLRIGDGRYVSEAYVTWSPHRPDLPWCALPSEPAPDTPSEFVPWAAEFAREVERAYGVPAPVTIAQAINESGWGRSDLTTEGNAYFGTKCFGTPGPIATGCRPYATTECDGANCFPTTDTFRVYRAVSASFADHGRFLTVNPRYSGAFAHTDDPNQFAREIHQAGYATDPLYSDKLIALMQRYDLYQYRA